MHQDVLFLVLEMQQDQACVPCSLLPFFFFFFVNNAFYTAKTCHKLGPLISLQENEHGPPPHKHPNFKCPLCILMIPGFSLPNPFIIFFPLLLLFLSYQQPFIFASHFKLRLSFQCALPSVSVTNKTKLTCHLIISP